MCSLHLCTETLDDGKSVVEGSPCDVRPRFRVRSALKRRKRPNATLEYPVSGKRVKQALVIMLSLR